MFVSKSYQETIDFGKKIATNLKGGDIVCLYGNLGTGKTTLVKGIAAGLGVREEITSPTFTLMNIYLCHLAETTRLVHIDTYRLKNENELVEIGMEDYLGQPNTICVTEWPEKIENSLKGKKIIKIEMEHGAKNQRIIKVYNNQ